MIEHKPDNLALFERELIHRLVKPHPLVGVRHRGGDWFVRAGASDEPGRASGTVSLPRVRRARSINSRRMWTAARLKKSRGVAGLRMRRVFNSRMTLFCRTSSVSARPRTLGNPRVIRAASFWSRVCTARSKSSAASRSPARQRSRQAWSTTVLKSGSDMDRRPRRVMEVVSATRTC